MKSSFSVGGEVAHGIAVDQVSQKVYVTVFTASQSGPSPGYVAQFDASGVPTANSPFDTGGEDLFTGVAVNPVTQGIYAYQTRIASPFGTFGVSKMTSFSSTGVVGTSFNPVQSRAPQIAVDSSGRIYFPNDTNDTVQILSSTGAVEATITCGACPEGAFSEPNTVALDSAGHLYVTDLSSGGRAIKFKTSGASYVYDSVLQSGGGIVGVGADPSTNDVFVVNLSSTHHVAAYDSSGTQFDDFGGGLIGIPSFGTFAGGQVAVNATTHDVYLTDPNTNKVWVFERVASIPSPTATTTAASNLRQVEATLNASVNPKGHGLTDCRFEYTDHPDFLVNGFANADSIDCSSTPIASFAVPASGQLTGLSPGTSYDYRIAIDGWGGEATGGAQTFSTLPPLPPDVTTGSASAITMTAATLGGSVNPRGGPISNCHFAYTDEADFGTNGFANAKSIDCTPKPTGTTSTSVSAKPAGLTAGTGYRFRVIATNNSGTTEGLTQSFTTVAATCENTPSLCPLPPAEGSAPTAPPPGGDQPTPIPPKKPLKCRRGFKKKKVRGKVKCVKIKRAPRKSRHRR